MKTLPLENTDYGVTLVDDGAYERLRWYHWHAAQNSGGGWYAIYRENGRRIALQNLVLRPSLGVVVDHMNGNTLDNQRSNLRLATAAQNVYNSRRPKSSMTPFVGVRRSANAKRWMGSIWRDYQHYHLGTFDAPEDAARAYDAAALRLFGEFARLNFPDAERIARGQPSQARHPLTLDDERARTAVSLLLMDGAALARDLDSHTL